MSRLHRGLVCLIPISAVAVLSLAIGLGVSLANLMAVVNSPLFMSTALAISILAFRRGEIRRVLLLGAMLSAALAALIVVRGGVPPDRWRLVALGFWLAAFLVCAHRTAKATGVERLRAFDQTLVVLALPLTVLLTVTGLWTAAKIVHSTYDNYFYVFDGLLPFPIARAVAQFCASHRWAWDTCTVIYNEFLLVLCAFVVLRWGKDGRAAGEVLGRWIVATLVGYALYYSLPGVGPDVAFYGASGSYLESLPAPPQQVELALLSGFDAWPNAMPSLHATWAFLIALISIEMTVWAWSFGAIYAVATIIATLGLREHYLIDLVVAVPFALAVHAGMGLMEHKGSRRRQFVAALGGAAMTVGWLLVIRYGTAPLRNFPSAATCLVLATILVSGWLTFRSEAEKRTSASAPSAGTQTATASRA